MRLYLILLTCAIAGIIPFLNMGTGKMEEKSKFVSPTSFNDCKLLPTAMSKTEVSFYKDFPGEAKYYLLENRPEEKLLFRYINEPSRLVHSIRTCYKAGGYAIGDEDNIVIQINELPAKPLTWSQFNIQENDHKYIIRQTILSLDNNTNYADIPAWYWLTTFSRNDKGPWLSVTWKVPAEN